jgi:hypothetical protein
MSRTYIMRHVPAVIRSSKKIAVGVGPEREKKTRDQIFRRVAEILGTPIREYIHYRYSHRYGYRHNQQITRAEWDLFYHIEENTIFPIRGPYWHPWRHNFPNNTAKTWHKRKANQKARRKTRYLLNHTQIDHAELLLPRKSEYYDTWSFD